jgi:hypothetical protein
LAIPWARSFAPADVRVVSFLSPASQQQSRRRTPATADGLACCQAFKGHDGITQTVALQTELIQRASDVHWDWNPALEYRLQEIRENIGLVLKNSAKRVSFGVCATACASPR